jgi:hypothetical protein
MFGFTKAPRLSASSGAASVYDERTDYLGATLRAPHPDGRHVATPHPLQDSSMLVPLATAENCQLADRMRQPPCGPRCCR